MTGEHIGLSEPDLVGTLGVSHDSAVNAASTRGSVEEIGMSATMMTPGVDAVVRAVARLDDAEFAAYGGGWVGEIGTALVDAVFSIQAKYHSTAPGKGVYSRTQAFRRAHPRATNDLRALCGVGAPELRKIMGGGRTGGRLKADCVIDAAQALVSLDPPVVTAADAVDAGAKDVERAYTSVPGLGWVTAEYFRMLLGVPGVKADIMIVRFVNEALAQAGLPAVDDYGARQLVMQAHEVDSRGVGLIAFEHAIWRAKGEVSAESGEMVPLAP